MKSSRFAVVVRRSVADKQLTSSIQPAWLIAKRSARKRSRPYIAECNDHGSNPVQGTIFFFHFYGLRLTRLTFNKSIIISNIIMIFNINSTRGHTGSLLVIAKQAST